MGWNNLFFVSMYDHLYQRGYVDSVTDDPQIAGSQAMCGCVEDMNPVARADCTEAVGRTPRSLLVVKVDCRSTTSPGRSKSNSKPAKGTITTPTSAPTITKKIPTPPN